MRTTPQAPRRSFTLIEAVVAVAIVGVVTSIGIAVYANVVSRAHQNSAYTTLQNIHREYAALDAYNRPADGSVGVDPTLLTGYSDIDLSGTPTTGDSILNATWTDNDNDNAMSYGDTLEYVDPANSGIVHTITVTSSTSSPATATGAVVPVGYPTGPAQSATALPQVRYDHRTFTTGDRIYVVGGTAGSCGLNTIYSTAYSGSNPSEVWDISSTGLVIARMMHAAALVDGTIWVAGGSACGNPQTTVQKGEIGSGGEVGPWSTTTALPSGRRRVGTGTYTDNTGDTHFYIVGGSNLSSGGILVSWDTVLRGTLNADGTVTWVYDTPLPEGRHHLSVEIVGNRMYAFGGSFLQTGAVSTDLIWSAPIDPDTGAVGAWNTVGTLPEPLRHHDTTVIGNRVYIAGGITASGARSDLIHVAELDPAVGTISTWDTFTQTLPEALNGHQLDSIDGNLLITGGYSNTGGVDTVRIIPLKQ